MKTEIKAGSEMPRVDIPLLVKGVKTVVITGDQPVHVYGPHGDDIIKPNAKAVYHVNKEGMMTVKITAVRRKKDSTQNT